MKKLFFLLALAIPAITFGQLTVKNAEDFTIGTVLKFQECDTTNVQPGGLGPNQTWDFSTLKATKDTVTEWMVSPSSTPSGSQFQTSNTVEKYSDGNYVYANKTADKSYLLGYVSSKSNMTINYPKPILFAERPYTFGVIISDSFTDNCASPYYSFNGVGSVILEPDGYGTLILPNKTYHNVLRVKVLQSETDTVKQYNSTSKMVSVTYAWFDGVNKSALLKISTTHSSSYNKKTVEYLLSEVDGKE